MYICSIFLVSPYKNIFVTCKHELSYFISFFYFDISPLKSTSLVQHVGSEIKNKTCAENGFLTKLWIKQLEAYPGKISAMTSLGIFFLTDDVIIKFQYEPKLCKQSTQSICTLWHHISKAVSVTNIL